MREHAANSTNCDLDKIQTSIEHNDDNDSPTVEHFDDVSKNRRLTPDGPTSNHNSSHKGSREKTNATNRQPFQNRHRLSKLLQLHGYSACREALVYLEDHFNSSTQYESVEDFLSKLNHVITFETSADNSIIDPDLAHTAIQKLCNNARVQDSVAVQEPSTSSRASEVENISTIKVKNVVNPDTVNTGISTGANSVGLVNEFNIHYNFLFKRLSALPIFQGDYQLMKLGTLTGSSQPSIKCVCFGLLVKDLSKIDGYMLIDSSGRVPVRITPDTSFRNRLAYANCIVIVEGVYINPDDILYAANIGLPPILLDPIRDKSLACVDDKLVVILKEIYMDDEDICKSLDMLFTGYNSMSQPPILFILIGDFTRNRCESISHFNYYTKKLVRIIRACDKLKDCHFVFVPGPRDSTIGEEEAPKTNPPQTASRQQVMPKIPLTKEHIQVNLLQLSDFKNIHLATNPVHIYLGDRQISVIAHSYFNEVKKNLLHDLSDHNEEFFQTVRQILLSNAHLAAGISKIYHSSLNLWHKPDLLILADTEVVGNKYDYSLSKTDDTSFTTVPSFSRQANLFKVYYVNTGEVEDSQVSSEALQTIELDDDDEPQEVPVELY